jgi:hypothetical protein
MLALLPDIQTCTGIVMFGDIATRFDGTINGAIALFAVRAA